MLLQELWNKLFFTFFSPCWNVVHCKEKQQGHKKEMWENYICDKILRFSRYQNTMSLFDLLCLKIAYTVCNSFIRNILEAYQKFEEFMHFLARCWKQARDIHFVVWDQNLVWI